MVVCTVFLRFSRQLVISGCVLLNRTIPGTAQLLVVDAQSTEAVLYYDIIECTTTKCSKNLSLHCQTNNQN
jgi:hypothetical protein